VTNVIAAGVDLGGTAINYTFVDDHGRFLIDGLFEHPARSKEGPDVCLQQIADGLEGAARHVNVALDDLAIVGLDTPGPATAGGVLSARGSTNFVHPAWAGFDIRAGLERKLGL
jgi:glucokinase